MTDFDETGVVRAWHDDEGWGVIDSVATPGGCWVHWSAVLLDGHRELRPGSEVEFAWEAVAQDGYEYRALRAWPAGQRAAADAATARDEASVAGSSMASTLVLTFDEPVDPETVQALRADGAVTAGAVTVRVGTQADLPDVRRLWSATFPALAVPDLRAALDGGRTLVLAALDDTHDGRPLVGAAVVGGVDDVPDERRLTVLADRPDRWLAVEAAAARHLRRQGVARWHVTVREDAEASVRQLEAVGYELASRSWGAVLLADAVDVARLRRLVDAAAADGVTLRRLAADDVDAAHQLVADCRADFPVTPATPAPHLTREQVRTCVDGEGRAAYGALTGADDDARLVGITALQLALGAEATADTDLTAVVADVRGRGVATALKAWAVLDLLQRGVRTFRTGGAAVNEASLRANRRVGYVVEPTWLTWSSR